MKTRTIRYLTAALAVFACLAGYAMTGSKAGAVENPLQGFTKEALAEALLPYCENAWHASEASRSCDFRGGGGISVDMETYPDYCVVNAHCRGHYYVGYSQYAVHHVSTSWRGSAQELPRLGNCNGSLKLDATWADCKPTPD